MLLTIGVCPLCIPCRSAAKSLALSSAERAELSRRKRSKKNEGTKREYETRWRIFEVSSMSSNALVGVTAELKTAVHSLDNGPCYGLCALSSTAYVNRFVLQCCI